MIRVARQLNEVSKKKQGGKMIPTFYKHINRLTQDVSRALIRRTQTSLHRTNPQMANKQQPLKKVALISAKMCLGQVSLSNTVIYTYIY